MAKKTNSLTVNLIPDKEIEFGERFLQWSLTFGRYIIIGTEIIVLIAFLSRFKLDRDLIDLNDQVKEKQRVLTNLKPVEESFLQLQARVTEIKNAELSQGLSIIALPSIASLTPAGITFKSISANGDKLTMVGITKETSEISQLVASLTASTLFKKDSVVLESIERGKDEEELIQFTVRALVERGKQ